MIFGGQGVHREVESEGLEEKCRAVIDEGYLKDEPVGQRWDKCRASTVKAKALLIHPPYQGVCGWHGTEEQCVTSGRLVGSLGGSQSEQADKRKRNGERRPASLRMAA
jgi:hypothetical protein